MTDATPENNGSSKKRRHHSVYGGSRTHDLYTFIMHGSASGFAGEFQGNVHRLITKFAVVDKPDTMGMPTWRFELSDEDSGIVIPFFVVEESVIGPDKSSCDYCRCHGWNHQFVSEKKYHIIIPMDDEWEAGSLNSNALNSTRHLLHGLIHSSGFGHLLLINGREGGSNFISGHKLMDLWDRLCTSLRVREVSVEDVSTKYSVDLRLLYGVAHGTSWFSRWEYYLYSHIYGIDKQSYKLAVANLSSLTLIALLNEVPEEHRNDVDNIISKYSKLKRMNTVRDLLRFLMDLNSKQLPPPTLTVRPKKQKTANGRKCHNFASVAASLDCRWPVSRLLSAAEVVVDTLAVRGSKMTRQEVRDAARLTIGDTGLIDFVLKSMDNTIVNGYLVHRMTSSRHLEFSITEPPIVDFSKDVVADIKIEERHEADDVVDQEKKDLQTLCKCICLIRPVETQLLLSAKYWVKTVSLGNENVEFPVDLLLRRKFLGACEMHVGMSNCELNRYCVKCDTIMCMHCVSEEVEHKRHRMIHIVPYVNQAAVKVRPLQKFIDCSNIQIYTLQSAPGRAYAQVLLLKPQKQSETSGISSTSTPCKTCKCAISVPNHYCSVYCKVSKDASPQTSDPEVISHDQNGGSHPSNRTPSPSQPSVLAREGSNHQMVEGTGNIVPSRRVRSRKGRPVQSPYY